MCHSTWKRDVVASVGRVKERARFRRAAGRSARDAYFEAAGFKQGPDGQWVEGPGDLDDDEGEEDAGPGGDAAPADPVQWEEDLSFPEIPHQQLSEHRWKVVMAQPWKKRGETIFVYEARALLRSLESFVSYVRKSNVRCVLLVDNMGVCLSFGRRRSKEFTVLTIIRRFSATCLALGIKCAIRWIPSEVSIADEPSRRFSKSPF